MGTPITDPSLANALGQITALVSLLPTLHIDLSPTQKLAIKLSLEALLARSLASGIHDQFIEGIKDVRDALLVTDPEDRPAA